MLGKKERKEGKEGEGKGFVDSIPFTVDTKYSSYTDDHERTSDNCKDKSSMQGLIGLFVINIVIYIQSWTSMSHTGSLVFSFADLYREQRVGLHVPDQ